MKKRIVLCALLIVFAMLTSSCSSGGNNDTDDIMDETPKAWAASDKSLHTAVIIPLKDANKGREYAENSLAVNSRLIDDIPVIELYDIQSHLAPVMFFLHEHEGNKEQFLDEASVYAQAGFFCIMFDLNGYGARTSQEVIESIESAVQATSDIELLLEYYRLNPHADTDHFVLYGQSMGGSAAWHYAAFAQKTPSAIVTCSAAANFEALSDLGAVKDGKGQSPAWDENRFHSYCIEHNPISQIDKLSQIPTLVYQGMNDNTIVPEITQQLEHMLMSTGRQNCLFIYDENGDHNVTPAFLARILPFLKQYIRIN